MSSTAPISLKTNVLSSLETVSLERYVTVAGNQVRRRARIPFMNDEIDPELACRVYDEFCDVASASRLSLNSGTLKFEFWRQCLQGQARRHWDSIVPDLAGTTNANFLEGIEEWFAKCMDPTAFQDQKEYFLKATKAHSMSVKETASRLKQICAYMCHMPGAPAVGTEIYSATELKMTLYRLMRQNWKSAFDASGNDITEDDYTWEMLVKCMTAQERRENVFPRGSPGHGNRQGRGGRGRGRYSSRGGRGYGGRHSGSYGGHQYSGGYTGHVRPYFGGQGGPPTQRPRYQCYQQGQSNYVPYAGRGFIPRGGGRGNYPQQGGNYGRGRTQGRGGRGSYGRGGRGSYGRGGRGRGGSAYQTDQCAIEDPAGAANETGNDVHAVESFDSNDSNGFDYHQTGENEEHWTDEQFGIFDDTNYGYDDSYTGYGDY